MDLYWLVGGIHSIPAPGVSSIHQRVIDTLASFLDVVYEYSRNCTQYFVLFSNSLRWYLDSGRVEIDHSKAVEKLLGMISNHSMVEVCVHVLFVFVSVSVSLSLSLSL